MLSFASGIWNVSHVTVLAINQRAQATNLRSFFSGILPDQAISMKDVLIILFLIAAYMVLMRYILPRLGVPT
jgi:hypothetical protein